MSGTDPDVERVVVDARPSAPAPRPLVLVTNDDGIDSPGIRELSRGLAADLDVVVAAPATDTSGSGTGADFADAAIPEPATVVMVMLASVGWCLRRLAIVRL